MRDNQRAVLAWLDLTNTFVSVPHQSLMRTLQIAAGGLRMEIGLYWWYNWVLWEFKVHIPNAAANIDTFIVP